jgi:spermidine dehydrogenase
MTITRRDFLNGAALTIATGMAPVQWLHAAQGAASGAAVPSGVYYPPALTGMRGNHPGTFTLAHSLAREGARYPTVLAHEAYDLVVIGAGISGLAAAWFYQRKHGANKRILILDNHDDFGGHAKRNEFTVRGHRLVTYGGSAEMPPSALDDSAMASLLAGLGVDARRMGAARQDDPYTGLGMGRAVFFDREHFGRDRLVAGDPFGERMEGVAASAGEARRFLDAAPLPPQDREALARLFDGAVDYLAGMPEAERLDYLQRTSYTAFLRERAGISLAGQRFLRSRTNDAFALDAEGVSVLDAQSIGLPAGANMPPPQSGNLLGKSPASRLWFPDGNASLARLLVQRLVPDVAAGATTERIATARFDYGKLDAEGTKVRVRLNSTAIAIEPDTRLVRVTYGWRGNLHRVEAAHVVVAGYNMMVPYMAPAMPDAQKQALRDEVKAPLVYTKVALDNWRAFQALKTRRIHAPTMAYTDLWLETPAGASPDAPVVLHMLYVPTVPDSGMKARDRFRAGRALLLGTPFDELERGIRAQLDRMLAPGGFAAKDVVRGITVNRWAHGYSYRPNTLFDDPATAQATLARARMPYGLVALAGSDSAGSPSVTAAVSQAWRAVEELKT